MWYGKFNLDNCTHTLDFMEACFLLLSFLESYRYYSSIRTRGLFTSKTTITSFRKYIVHTAMHRHKTALFVRHERLFVRMQQFQHNILNLSYLSIHRYFCHLCCSHKCYN